MEASPQRQSIFNISRPPPPNPIFNNKKQMQKDLAEGERIVEEKVYILKFNFNEDSDDKV